MNLDRLKRWRRSLLAQMTALITIFLVFAVIYFALVPYFQYRSENDPLERTRSYATREILSATFETGGYSIDALGESEILSEIAAANGMFRYYVRQGEKRIQFGGAPKWEDAIDFSHPELESVFETAGDADCTTRGFWSARFADDGIVTYIYYRECNGEKTYAEHAGIAYPISRTESLLTLQNLGYFWATTQKLVVAALVFVLIAGLVLLLAARSLRRVANVAKSVDVGRKGGQLLPDEGIPSEILPLVGAINEMARRLHENQERQQFFLATAAHEMRTPMTILRTRLEELPDSPTKNEVRDDVRRMVTLVDQLLCLMNVQSRDELPEEIDIVTLARAVAAERAPLAMNRGVEIELRSDLEKHVVRGDEGLMSIALANLIDNAVSFSRQGDVVLVRIDRAGAVSVRDRGPGIAEEETELVFEPFAKRPPNRKGHGLGLAIVKAVMRLHNGEVTVSNAAGGGARFVLRFKSLAERGVNGEMSV